MWAVYFLLTVLILLGILEMLSARNPEGKLFVSMEPEEVLVEQDTPFILSLSAANEDKLPFSYVQIRQMIPDFIEAAESAEKSVHVAVSYWDYRVVKDAFMIAGRRTLTRKYPVIARQRGVWHLENLQLNVGDFLAIRERILYERHKKEVVVMPKPLESVDLSKAMGGFLGELSVRRFLYEDPVLISGFSDYSGREPMKAISWKQTARMGRMVVKNQDHTTETSVKVILDFEGAGEYLELLLSLTRSVCETLESMRVNWSFACNGDLNEKAGMRDMIESGSGSGHMMALLEGLGRTKGRIKMPFSFLIDELLREKTMTSGYLILRGKRSLSGYDRSLVRLSELTGCPVNALYACDYEIKEDSNVQS